MELIKQLWRGGIPLSTAFWRFGVGVSVLVNAAILYVNLQPDMLETAVGMLLFLLLIVFAVIYSPFILISIWRSANRYQGLGRNAVAAKVVVILGWGRYLQSLAEFAKEFSG
jgi:hypothetical protein